MDPNVHPEAPIELTAVPSLVPATSAVPPSMMLCSYCHQPILSTYFFCPNCGTKVDSGELSTSPATQAWIYIISIVLPIFVCCLVGFLVIKRWPALKYYRSADPKAKQIGMNAFVLLAVSTILTLWLGYVWSQELIQSQVSSINADLNADMGP